MVKLESLDPTTNFGDQLAQHTGPVVLVNMFTVPAGEEELMLSCWQDDAKFMKAQPGYVSAQLHRGTGDSSLMLNIAVWESSAALQKAFSDPEFQSKHDRYPESVVIYPHLFEKVAVDGICIA
ncbi:antibiotic biosynthesis monooxygenase family protein [Amycolatopsis nigrescens]|uniref:antibiotic biosynthesis monooxygenase family protein n=1 Tax=Amycolatopsis nigrescens TaxID=381445 RepID=UPI00037300DD|nr:antibiotic biosynthesis monooxygenase family protein [Amycolatopsis nigrescens]